MSNPNCYQCKYRGPVPGSAHSSCRHPEVKELVKDPVLGVLALFASDGRQPSFQGKSNLNVIGDPHGVANGWFVWPWDFDPAWLRSCDGFTKKEDENSG